MSGPIRLLLVDDNATFQTMLADYLRAYDDLLVVGTADSGRTGLARALDLQPDVVLLDLRMPGLPGLEVLPHLHAALPQTGIIVVSQDDLDTDREAAFTAGADAFISKMAVAIDLVPAIRQVAEGYAHLSESLPGQCG